MDDSESISQAVIDDFVGAAHGDTEKVKRLLEEQPRLVEASASWGETAIEAAAQTGSFEIIDMLLARGAGLDICTAAVLGKQEMVKTLLEADPTLAEATGAHGIPVLYFAIIGKHRDMADLLFERGADVNAGEGIITPLHGAVVFDHPTMVEWLLAHDALVRVVDSNGKTPKELAVENNQNTIIEMLRQAEEEQDEQED